MEQATPLSDEAVAALARELGIDAQEIARRTGQRPADVLKFSETDIKEGTLSLTQDKTGKRLRMAITGELAVVIERIMARKRSHQVRSLELLCNDNGQPLTKGILGGGFERARTAACINFQMRDLRAKAGTDKAVSHDIRAAQKQLGHSTIVMTEHFVRNRKGDSVDPTK